MLKKLACLVFIFAGALSVAWGQQPTPKEVQKEKPVSVSYTNLVKCYPALKNEAQSLKVDLNQVKEDADRKFVTSQSLLRYRQVVLKDDKGQQTRLKLLAKPLKQKKFNYQLTVEKLDNKGSGSLILLPASQRINPQQKDLDSYFLDQEILEDEYSYFDTKLNGLHMAYKRNFKNVFEIELIDEKSHHRLFCEDKKDLGVVCNCFQK